MSRRRSATSLVLTTGCLLTGLLAVPAQAAPEAAGEVPTHPRSLVNDPAEDTTASDTVQNSVTVTTVGSNVVAAYNDTGSADPGQVYGTGYSVSVDGGITWADRGDLYDGPLTERGDPSLAADDTSGRVYLASRVEDGDVSNLLVHRSDDSGLTFGAPVVATSYSDTTSGPQFPRIAVDDYSGAGQGSVYLAWVNIFGPAQTQGIRLSVSTDGAETWEPEVGTLVSDAGLRASRPDVAITADHCVHVVYLVESIFSAEEIQSRTTCDAGQTMEPPVTLAAFELSAYGDLGIAGAFDSPPYPQLAANPVTGALYVTFAKPTGNRGADVFVASSTDGGATWSAPSRVGGDRGRADQFSPSIAVTPDGRQVMVGFFDRRADPINLDIQRWGQIGLVNLGTDAISWQLDFQLSPGFRPPDCCFFDGRAEFTSGYEEIGASAGAFHPAWTDYRDSDAFQPYQPDIRSARIRTGTVTDIAVSVSGAPPTTVPLGATYAYTATVTNASPNAADNVIARTTLPIGNRFISASAGGASLCYRLGQDVSCGLGTLAAGASRTVTVVAQALAGGPLVRAVSATTSTSDGRPANNVRNAAATVTSPPTAVTTYSTGDIAVRIPERGGDTAVVPLDIAAGEGIALDIDVVFRAQHANVQEIGIVLISPDERVVPLSTNNGFSTGRNYGTGPNDCSGNATIFDDSAGQSIIDAPAFFKGTFNPEGTLSDVAGEEYDGTWRLRITDPTGSYIGTVGCFQLRITHQA